ncbi:hypothetical protein ABIA30_005026 [Mycobacterium sp. MAA66]|jgi:hypothetical protein|uniref:hypothetical protein n=1 Tax=Mycobacterium sp. MAA66 TaxID=3156297 RepID=UPI003517A732
MKKFMMALSATTVLTAATLGLAGPAMASPAAPLPQCGVHVVYNGADVNVGWC